VAANALGAERPEHARHHAPPAVFSSASDRTEIGAMAINGSLGNSFFDDN
jgi:hypothetical protein